MGGTGGGGGGDDEIDEAVENDDAYHLLARCIRRRLDDSIDGGDRCDVSSISNALRSSSSTQMALKRIDGAAHELYQRTHRSSTSLDDDDGEEGGDGGGGGGGGGGKGGLKVAGRMSRNAARVGCVADALFASELCELASTIDSRGSDGRRRRSGRSPSTTTIDEDDGTLASWTGREVVFNATIPRSFATADDDDASLPSMSVLVIYEREYDGGAGVDHGGVDDLLSLSMREEGGETPSSHPSGEEGGAGGKVDVVGDDPDDSISAGVVDAADIPAKTSSSSPRGRYLVVLSDHRRGARRGKSTTSPGGDDVDLSSIISILDAPPVRLGRLPPPTKAAVADGKGSATSACEPLYRMAGRVLEAIGPVVLPTATTTNATYHDGGASDENRGDHGDHRSRSGPAIHFVGHSLAGGVAALSACIVDGTIPHPPPRGKHERKCAVASLTGSGRGRASALCLGAPPCLSSNIRAPFITSVIHGDDIVCRTTRASIDNLCDRTIRSIKGGLLGRSVGWVSGAVSLTVSGIRSGKEGGKLVVPGKVFLVRPRRMGGGSSSIHEVGGRSGESLRAALLWQLNDVLLSKSLWSHHQLDAYIRSLDRVRLKGFMDDQSIETN